MRAAVTKRFGATVLLALVLCGASAVTFPVPRDGTPAQAQQRAVAAFEYEVLPGLQPGFTPGPVSSFVPTGLKETCGWHRGSCPSRTDIATAAALDVTVDREATTFGEPVYAAFRAVQRNATFTAHVHDVNTPGSCKKVKIRVLDGSGKPVAELWYTHVIASVVTTNTINLQPARRAWRHWR